VTTQTFTLRRDEDRHQIRMAIARLPMDGKGYKVTIKEADTRTLDQNAKLWALLTDISRQVEWHGRRLPPEAWKDILTAALRKAEVVPGLDGGFVALGLSTSQMTRRELGELLDLADAFGSQNGVRWTAPERELR
jgi:hypothetical protein